MSTLVVIEYDDSLQARRHASQASTDGEKYLIDLEDAVVATKDEKGKIRLNQSVNLTNLGAVSGGFWGTLIGLIS